MATLLERIEADAQRLLAVPEGRGPREELPRFKRFLTLQNHRLKIYHRNGATGRDVCQARACMFDLLLRAVWDAVRKNVPPQVGIFADRMALIALGGYGRGELNPLSDIDILILHQEDNVRIARGKPHPFLVAITGEAGLMYMLDDLGIKVGHRTRNIDDCVRLANSDVKEKTSMIEARLITGSDDLFKRMQNVILARCVMGYEDAYIGARLEDQAQRRTKFGDSACMLKNGCGGLRDFQNLVWMTFVKYRTRSLQELEERELISDAERRELEAAYEFLLRSRNSLHYHTASNRPNDDLTKHHQPAVAADMGFGDRSPSRRIEKFMRVLYLHMRSIDLTTRTVEQRLALHPQPGAIVSLRDFLRRQSQKARQQIVDGFQIVDGEIHATNSRVFRDQPRRLMRVFLHAQQRGVKLGPDLRQLLRNQATVVNRAFLRDPHVHQTFLEILNQRGNVSRIVRLMHEVDFLGKYMPEFGKLTCLVQHEFFHQYATDEHTLVCLERLDEIWGATKPPLDQYREVFQRVEHPSLLYLALLLHDAGKACDTGNHSQAGAKLAQRIGRRLNLDAATAQSLDLLVQQHLAMVTTSQRRDMDDPEVIRNFASLVGTTERLDLLTLLTVADARGTNEKLWNDFKDSLLWTLHRRTRQLIEGGADFIREEEKRRRSLAEEVRQLVSDAVGAEELDAHFATLPPRYFQSHSAKEVAHDLSLIHKFMLNQVGDNDDALNPIIAWQSERDRAYSSVEICTWDRAGLFGKMCGCFTAAGLNILSARIFTRSDAIVLDTFYVTDARTGGLAAKEQREKFDLLLLKSLTGHLDFGPLLARIKLPSPLYQAAEGQQIPTLIHFDNSTSDDRTVIEIQTEDRVGLLYAISQALAELRLDISVAKINTEKGAALDNFYVTETGGGKVKSPERCLAVENRLRTAIAALDKAA
jgi:[protein-PII] uridylyltransferase